MSLASRLLARIQPPAPRPADAPRTVRVGDADLPLLVVRNLRARRYLLRLRPDKTARVTVPRGGSVAEALRFVERQRAWLELQLGKLSAQAVKPAAWQHGTLVLFRGEQATLAVDPGSNVVQFGDQSVSFPESTSDLRPFIERRLWKLAARELPPRVLELAALHGLRVNRVTVRSQRSRWGSCSRLATISLNWRIIQAPDSVRDYLILHELMHLRQMNHSARFWREVARVCPDFKAAEHWLKAHNDLLR